MLRTHFSMLGFFILSRRAIGHRSWKMFSNSMKLKRDKSTANESYRWNMALLHHLSWQPAEVWRERRQCFINDWRTFWRKNEMKITRLWWAGSDASCPLASWDRQSCASEEQERAQRLLTLPAWLKPWLLAEFQANDKPPLNWYSTLNSICFLYLTNESDTITY